MTEEQIENRVCAMFDDLDKRFLSSNSMTADEYEALTKARANLGKDVANFRKLARHGLAELSRMSRRGYGNAVLAAILVKQKQALQRELPSHNVSCASGTNHTTGKDILKAVAAQNRAACLAKGDFDQAEANAKYEEAMKAKHGKVEWRQAA